MSTPKQISRAEMERLLSERCPTMSPPTREAALTGSVLQLEPDEAYQAPPVNDGRATHHVVMRAAIRKVGDQWIN